MNTLILKSSVAVLLAMAAILPLQAQTDPGVRGGAPGAGGPIDSLTASESSFFQSGEAAFLLVRSVQGTMPNTGVGLGARFNLDSCGGCHSQPANGGTSPSVNPQVATASAFGAKNKVPFFVTLNGPVREARFKRNPDGTPDGGVHNVFTITGRSDARGCNISQPDFDAAAAGNNVVFRIPTPVFGLGLIAAISDSTIVANMNASSRAKRALGIHGAPNHSGNDGTITRFGWKAQNKSLAIFAGEGESVELGVSNEMFQNEREETPNCVFNGVPEDRTNFDAANPADVMANFMKIENFMRFLAPPTPVPESSDAAAGHKLFNNIGCVLCHTDQLVTGNASSAALSNRPAPLFSDLLLHHMGPGLADDVVQGEAAGDQFRTSLLWGLGQRIFFLHDGRANDLLAAIRAHQSAGNATYPDSEANGVIDGFNALTPKQQQQILVFLRGL